MVCCVNLFYICFEIYFCFKILGLVWKKPRACGWTPFSPRWSISSSVLLQVSPPLSASRSILKKGILLKEKQFLNVVFAVVKCLPYKVRICKAYHSICPLVGIGSLPAPLSSASVPIPPEPGGTRAGEGLGESQFRRLEKSLALCLLCGLTHLRTLTCEKLTDVLPPAIAFALSTLLEKW